MKCYKHILLAVDFSEGTDCLVKRASEMALLDDTKLSIVHILDNIPMPDISYGTVITLNDETDNSLLEQEKAKLNEIGNVLNVPENQRWLIWGSPKEEICALAEQELHGIGEARAAIGPSACLGQWDSGVACVGEFSRDGRSLVGCSQRHKGGVLRSARTVCRVDAL